MLSQVTFPKILVGIHGKQKAGKTTLSEALLEQHPDWLRDSFARPLKDGCSIMGVETGDHSPNKNRKVLQDIGVYFRGIDPNWWVNLFIRNALNTYKCGVDVVVCDDLRFRNELSALQDFRESEEFEVLVYLVHIEVSEKTQAERGAAMDRLNHVSEIELDNIDPEVWDLWIPEESTVAQRVQWVEQLIGLS
jgi:hypothetical protein